MQLFGVGLRHELALHEVALVVIAPEARRERQHPVARFGPGVGAEVGLQALLRLHAVKIRREIVRVRKVVAQQQVLVRVRIGREDLIDKHPVREIDIDVAVRLKDLGIRKIVELGKHAPVAQVVPVEHGHGIAEVLLIIVLTEDAAAAVVRAVFAVLGVILLIIIAVTLEHSVADVRIRDRDPGIDIRVHGLQLVEIDRNLHASKLEAAGISRGVGAHPVAEGLALIVLNDVPHAPRARTQRCKRHKHQHTAHKDLFRFHRSPHKTKAP